MQSELKKQLDFFFLAIFAISKDGKYAYAHEYQFGSIRDESRAALKQACEESGVNITCGAYEQLINAPREFLGIGGFGRHILISVAELAAQGDEKVAEIFKRANEIKRLAFSSRRLEHDEFFTGLKMEQAMHSPQAFNFREGTVQGVIRKHMEGFVKGDEGYWQACIKHNRDNADLQSPANAI